MRPVVLLIDDDHALVADLAGHLEAAGFHAVRASNLSYALQVAADRRPDMVLLDVECAGSAGWEALGTLVEQAPTIVISAAGREEDVVRGFGAGVADYVVKPVRPHELVARVQARLPAQRSEPAPSPPPATAPDIQPAAEPVGASTLAPPVRAGSPAPPSARTRRHPRARDDDQLANQVFIDRTDEASLIAEAAGDTGVDLADTAEPHPPLPLGVRLKQARTLRRLSLVQAEIDTRVRMWYLQAMEEGKFALLPRGQFGLQQVRTYAAYLGMDADAVVDEYRRLHYSETIEPPGRLGGPAVRRPIPVWIFVVLAVVLALVVGIGAIALFDPGTLQRLIEQL